jgi:hypothetical protein
MIDIMGNLTFFNEKVCGSPTVIIIIIMLLVYFKKIIQLIIN